MEKTIKLIPGLKAEDFYGNESSVYVRLTYHPEKEGYKVLIFNAMKEEDMDENSVKLCILARGLAELALDAPTEVFNVGYTATTNDSIDTSEELSETEKELLKNPIGSA